MEFVRRKRKQIKRGDLTDFSLFERESVEGKKT